jgi:hypothetical protein
MLKNKGEKEKKMENKLKKIKEECFKFCVEMQHLSCGIPKEDMGNLNFCNECKFCDCMGHKKLKKLNTKLIELIQ